jgi:hypothetical protein
MLKQRNEIMIQSNWIMIQPKGNRMSQSDLRNEINAAEAEPLLPVEKKLIGWSLGLGIALLAVLIAVNHFVPIKL